MQVAQEKKQRVKSRIISVIGFGAPSARECWVSLSAKSVPFSAQPRSPTPLPNSRHVIRASMLSEYLRYRTMILKRRAASHAICRGVSRAVVPVDILGNESKSRPHSPPRRHALWSLVKNHAASSGKLTLIFYSHWPWNLTPDMPDMVPVGVLNLRYLVTSRGTDCRTQHIRRAVVQLAP